MYKPDTVGSPNKRMCTNIVDKMAGSTKPMEEEGADRGRRVLQLHNHKVTKDAQFLLTYPAFLFHDELTQVLTDEIY